ncbi:MAG TPA: hypothetical protein PLS24_01540 [Sedimentisphaerales bacterium]|nr:hypothetical protein [Sedimentisphaerales bacterium]
MRPEVRDGAMGQERTAEQDRRGHWRGFTAEWSAGGQTQAAHLPDG